MSDLTLRETCGWCGCSTGHIITKGMQDVVYCDNCDRYQYNAPRLETGRAQRSLTTRPGVPPSMRARIFDRFGHACIDCGGRPPEVRLELDHVIPRELAAEHGMLDELIDSEWNLAPACAECNSGRRTITGPQLQLLYRCILLSQRSNQRSKP